MNVETRIKLDRFKPRQYQKALFDAIENKGYKRVMLIWPRRAGKDMAAWQLCIRECLRKVQVIYYIFPTYSQAKKVIWQSVTNDGQRVLDFVPDELVKSKNSQDMSVRFINGSLLQLVGSDNYDSLMGTNPGGCVFSEYALQDPRAYQFLRPILLANDGWAVFLSTPRGKNHLWELYQIAANHPEWYVQKLTVNDTLHVSLHEIEKDRAEGVMSDDMIQQEWYTSFDMGVEGSYYAKYLDRMRLNGQIGVVPYEPQFRVSTSWDLGFRDSTSIIFFQIVGQTIRIIDFYQKNKEGMEHYIDIVNSKKYNYNRHIAPHDIRVHEFSSGMSRWEKARQLGVNFTVAPDLTIPDGIEAVRSTLPKMWINEATCGPLIKSLEGYRQEYDSKRNVYKPQPLHDINSHAADAMRYLCISLPKMRDSLSAEDLEKRYQETVYGGNSNLPSVFRDDLPTSRF